MKYALIGCGAAGRVHAYHFTRGPGIEAAYCIDPNGENALFFQKHFGFKRSYASLEAAREEEKTGIASIATPPSGHRKEIEFLLKKEAHILCEKPLVIEPSDTAIVETAAGQGKLLGIMLPRRFYNNSLAVRKALDANALGKIRKASFTLECQKEKQFYEGWRGQKKFVGGGVLMSQTIHSIDQLVFFFGPALSVEGKVWAQRDYIDVEDEAQGQIVFKNGVEVTLRATTNSTKHLWKGITEIEGEKGCIVLDSEKTIEWQVPGEPPPLAEEEENVPPEFKPAYYGPGHLKVIRNFAAAVPGREVLRTEARSSLEALRLIWAFYGRKIS